MKLLRIKTNIKPVLTIFLIAICMLETVLILKGDNFNLTDLSLEKLAQSVISKCEKSTYKPTCYDNEIPKLMDFISMEDAFKVTQIVQESDRDYRYCHVLGHKLSAREVAKDPSKWQEVVTRCPTTMCNNGCLHGGMMERFESELLNSQQIKDATYDLSNVCEPRGDWKPLEVERSMCYHAIGHLNMYITGGNMQQSADLCRVEGVKADGRDYRQTCVQGVFMQVFQPLEPEDFALVAKITPKKKDIPEFCDKYEPFLRGACYRESWPLFRNEIMTSAGSISFCSYSKDLIENERCYSGLMSVVTIHYLITNHNQNGLYEYCVALPAPHDRNCFGDAAERMIQIDPEYTKEALQICTMADKAHFGDSCRRDLSDFAKKGLKNGSPQYMEVIDYANKK